MSLLGEVTAETWGSVVCIAAWLAHGECGAVCYLVTTSFCRGGVPLVSLFANSRFSAPQAQCT